MRWVPRCGPWRNMSLHLPPSWPARWEQQPLAPSETILPWGAETLQILSQKKSFLPSVAPVRCWIAAGWNHFNIPCSCVFPGPRRKLVILLSFSEVIPCHPCHAPCLPRETPTQLSQACIGLFYPAAKPKWWELQHINITPPSMTHGLEGRNCSLPKTLPGAQLEMLQDSLLWMTYSNIKISSGITDPHTCQPLGTLTALWQQFITSYASLMW